MVSFIMVSLLNNTILWFILVLGFFLNIEELNYSGFCSNLFSCDRSFLPYPYPSRVIGLVFLLWNMNRETYSSQRPSLLHLYRLTCCLKCQCVNVCKCESYVIPLANNFTCTVSHKANKIKYTLFFVSWSCSLLVIGANRIRIIYRPPITF